MHARAACCDARTCLDVSEDGAGAGTGDGATAATGADLGSNLHIELLSLWLPCTRPRARGAQLREGHIGLDGADRAGANDDGTTGTTSADFASNLHIELLSLGCGLRYSHVVQRTTWELDASVGDGARAGTTTSATSANLGSNLHIELLSLTVL
jgi:hypothetical protein